ncbi:MAG: protease inhibitor I42 family protein [Candidatus Cryosericum sp.]|jgi:inhibitor of cysteine peptidase
MKKRVLFAIVAVIVIAAAAVAVAIVTASGRDKVTGDTFETTVGRTFTIALDANPTTGFGWRQSIKDPAIVAYVSDAYVAENRDPQVVGGGGTHTFTFKALIKGTTTITLSYARVWESVPAAQSRTITVTVK